MSNQTNQNPLVSRIERIQSAHPWMLEREARFILVSSYAALTNVCGFRGVALETEMEHITEKTVDASREVLERLLTDLANVEEED